ncbi:MAG: DNA-directed RNA polymerase subunit B, partial [Thermoprotei archaeon]
SSRFEDSLYRRYGVQPLSAVTDLTGLYRVYFDGRLIGYHKNVYQLAEELRSRRRSGQIPAEISVALMKSPEGKPELAVTADSGRIMRPLIVVRDGESALTPRHIEDLATKRLKWSDLVAAGVIEYLDAGEEENATIAVDLETLKNSPHPEKYTHVEIAPWAIMGVVASIIPYSNHNQSPRNRYESAM